MSDQGLADRVRTILEGRKGITEQPMFGGICFMLNGNMMLGASGARGLLVRVGKNAHDAALKRPHTRPMEMRGRSMVGYLYVDDAATKRAADLKAWVDAAMAFATTLPPKAKAAPARKTAPAKKPAAARKKTTAERTR